MVLITLFRIFMVSFDAEMGFISWVVFKMISNSPIGWLVLKSLDFNSTTYIDGLSSGLLVLTKSGPVFGPIFLNKFLRWGILATISSAFSFEGEKDGCRLADLCVGPAVEMGVRSHFSLSQNKNGLYSRNPSFVLKNIIGCIMFDNRLFSVGLLDESHGMDIALIVFDKLLQRGFSNYAEDGVMRCSPPDHETVVGVNTRRSDGLNGKISVDHQLFDQVSQRKLEYELGSERGLNLIIMIMIGTGNIGLEYTDETNEGHCISVGLCLQHVSLEGIKINVYGEIWLSHWNNEILMADVLLRKLWRNVLRLLQLMSSWVLYHLDWCPSSGLMMVGTAPAEGDTVFAARWKMGYSLKELGSNGCKVFEFIGRVRVYKLLEDRMVKNYLRGNYFRKVFNIKICGVVRLRVVLQCYLACCNFTVAPVGILVLQLLNLNVEVIGRGKLVILCSDMVLSFGPEMYARRQFARHSGQIGGSISDAKMQLAGIFLLGVGDEVVTHKHVVGLKQTWTRKRYAGDKGVKLVNCSLMADFSMEIKTGHGMVDVVAFGQRIGAGYWVPQDEWPDGVPYICIIKLVD